MSEPYSRNHWLDRAEILRRKLKGLSGAERKEVCEIIKAYERMALVFRRRIDPENGPKQ